MTLDSSRPFLMTLDSSRPFLMTEKAPARIRGRARQARAYPRPGQTSR